MTIEKRYEMPCGCSFATDETLPPVGGRPSIILNFDEFPFDCPITWELISSGRTKGVFQLESPLGRQWAKRLKPMFLEHLTALGSILRPGCLQAKDERGVSMTELYCRRKNGEEETTYYHPALEPILNKTYGIVVYQEQSMKIATELAGFDAQEADVLRKCVTDDTQFVSKTRGWISIRRLLREGFEDDLFLVMDERGRQQWKRLEKIWFTGKHDVNTIQSSSGMRVRATKYHQFLTKDGWKARVRLSSDDQLVVARSVEYDGKDDITADFALVLAGILAEGYFVHQSAHFTNYDPEMMSVFQGCFESTFGKDKLRIAANNRVVGIRKKERLFIRQFIDYGLSDSRRLPDVMMGMTKESTRKFLSYLLACEGGVSEAGQFEFSSKSPQLPQQVQLLLLRFGIRSLLLEYPEKERYRLYINDVEEQTRLYEELTEFWPKPKADTLRRIVEKKTGNYTTDTIPQQFVKNMLDQYPFAGNGEGGSIYSQPISRNRFIRVAERTGDKNWVDFGRGHQAYDGAIIAEKTRQVKTYDFTVAGGDTPYIIANGLVIHNSIGKKDTQLMAKAEQMFLEKAKSFGIINDEQAKYIFDNIKKSARYQFNKSHSACYAVIGYHTAYLKTHFPIEFFTSYLYNAKEKQDPLKEIRELVNDARSFGFDIQPPRFADLEPNFSTDHKVVIKFGLSDVKGIGDAVVKRMQESIDQIEANCEKLRIEWSWFDWLVYFSDIPSSSVVKRMIEVGAMRDYGSERQKLLAEYEVWQALSEKERESIASLDKPVYKMEAVKETVEVEEPEYDPVQWADYQAALTEENDQPIPPKPVGTKKVTKKVSKRGDDGKIIYRVAKDKGGEPVMVDGPRPVDNLTDALTQLLKRPKAVMTNRVPKVKSLLQTLKRPPRPLVDDSQWKAKVEEEALGLPITCNRGDDVMRTKANTTCRDYREGKDESDMVFAVDIQDFREVTIKNGDNRGKKMGFLTIRDKTGSLEDVTIFSDAYERFGNFVYAGNTVELKGRRDARRGSLIVEEVWV